MKTKQEIILNYYRAGDSVRKISRELGINRKTVTKYIKAYDAQLKKFDQTSDEAKGELIDDIVKPATYNTKGRCKRKLTPALISQVEDYLEANSKKRQQGQR